MSKKDSKLRVLDGPWVFRVELIWEPWEAGRLAPNRVTSDGGHRSDGQLVRFMSDLLLPAVPGP